MRELEEKQRAALIAAARSWIGTRFHHNSAVRRTADQPGGIDCANLLLEAHVGARLAKRFDAGSYPHDWHQHQSEERFLAALERHLKPIGDSDASIRDRGPDFSVLPGNVLIFKFDLCFSHGAIASEWPMIIHASLAARSCIEESSLGGRLERVPCRIYSFWGR